MWLSWWGIILQSERSLVQFPVRAHAWVAGSVPGWGMCGKQPIVFLSLSFYVPSPSLKISKIFLKTQNKNINSCELERQELTLIIVLLVPRRPFGTLQAARNLQGDKSQKVTQEFCCLSGARLSSTQGQSGKGRRGTACHGYLGVVQKL